MRPQRVARVDLAVPMQRLPPVALVHRPESKSLEPRWVPLLTVFWLESLLLPLHR